MTLPEAVWNEVVVEGQGQPGAEPIRDASWIKTQAASNRDLVRALRQDLDPGEAEALALAVESDAPLLIMDEQQGRARAEQFEVPCIGVIGVFIEANDRGHVQAVQPVWMHSGRTQGFASAMLSIIACCATRESIRTDVTINEPVDVIERAVGVNLEREYDRTKLQEVDGRIHDGCRDTSSLRSGRSPETTSSLRSGRNSDNTRILNELGWEPPTALRDGIEVTAECIEEQIKRHREAETTSRFAVAH